MYTLKSIARRGTLLGAAFALLAATLVPALPVYADALNPLTDRSLTLSSSAPGWDYLDGSGNSTYAPPNSGANGQKVGNTYEFKVSTDSTVSGTNEPVKAMTFQYCTSPAGSCLAPGNNIYTDTTPGSAVRGPDTATTSDLNVTVAALAGNAEVADLTTYVDTTASDGRPTSIPAANATAENFVVYYRTSDNGTPSDDTDDNWAQSTGWSMAVINNETGAEEDLAGTGANNEIQLTNATGEGFTAGQMVRVIFFATDTNYITNPGAGAFFVRINTYKVDTAWDSDDVIDGGVTVANVMNLGIQIITKVLETMDFSVGVVDPYTLEAIADDAAPGGADETSQFFAATGRTEHSVCEPVLTKMDYDDTTLVPNRLQMGDDGAEFSLATSDTYSTHSYFRLSSNSSAGATVYYSGNTLTNTVGDFINASGDPDGNNVSDGLAHAPTVGSEQFGIALDHQAGPNYLVDYDVERESGFVFEEGADNAAAAFTEGTWGTRTIHSSVEDNAISDLTANASWHTPQLFPLVPEAAYADGEGTINNEGSYGALSTTFAFQPTSMLVPVALASNDSQVVDCITGKVNYIANIAATTPAGIYTTKVNYIASPQY